MARAHSPFKFYIGDTWYIDAIVADEDDEPIDISGADQVEWKLDTSDRATNLLTFTLGSGVDLIAGGEVGQCLITVTPAQSAAIAAGYYVDQLRVTIGPIVSVQAFGVIQVLAPLV